MKQMNLKGMLEFTALCGFIFAVGPGSDWILDGIAGAVIAVWSLRLNRLPFRWFFFNWFLMLSAMAFGFGCLQWASVSYQMVQLSLHLILAYVALFVVAPLTGLNAILFFASWLLEGKRSSSYLTSTADRP